MSFTIEVQGLNELMNDVKTMGGNAERLVNAALTNSVSQIRKEARRLAPHAFGKLQDSIQYRVDYPEAKVFVGEKYGIDVEKGTGPHMPPVDALRQWAIKRGMPGAEWAIAMKIKKHGTKAHPFFEPGIENSKDYITEQFTKVLDKIISGLAGRGF